MTGMVSAERLAEMLGYRSGSIFNAMVKSGAMERPQMVLGLDCRWRRCWSQAYVDGLMTDPPPRLRARVEERKRVMALEARAKELEAP